jgi:hypothetical protein
LLFRAPIGGARHGALQWLQALGVLDAPAPLPGLPVRPDSDLALYRELAARLGHLLPSTIAPETAVRASSAPAL